MEDGRACVRALMEQEGGRETVVMGKCTARLGRVARSFTLPQNSIGIDHPPSPG